MASHALPGSTPETTKFDGQRKIKHGPLLNNLKQRPYFDMRHMQSEGQNSGALQLPFNSNIPAGYTYLGQFLAHDVTVLRNMDIDLPDLRLHSLYGGGPSMMPDVYAHYEADLEDPAMFASHCPFHTQYEKFRAAKFRLLHVGGEQFDVPRTQDYRALIADARNDQNFLLFQLHCAFIRFHNAMADFINFASMKYALMYPDGLEIKGTDLFHVTRKVVIWYYQQMLVEDYVKRMMHDYKDDKKSSALLKSLIDNQKNYKLYEPKESPRIMPEFSLAAMRVGHSQVQEVYALNMSGQRLDIFNTRRKKREKGMHDLRGFSDYEYLNFEWRMYFDTMKPLLTAQSSSSIDHYIAKSLFDLPFLAQNEKSLPILNIKRSADLPTGIQLASALAGSGHPDLVTQADLDKIFGAGKVQLDVLPLWVYILLEAEIKENGERLGLLGSRIIAEQVLWIMQSDKNSYYYTGKTNNSTNEIVKNSLSNLKISANHQEMASIISACLDLLKFEPDMGYFINFPNMVKSIIDNEILPFSLETSGLENKKVVKGNSKLIETTIKNIINAKKA